MPAPLHERGPGPGHTASLPYFTVAELAATLERGRELGGSIIHPHPRSSTGTTAAGAKRHSGSDLPLAWEAAAALIGGAELVAVRTVPSERN